MLSCPRIQNNRSQTARLAPPRPGVVSGVYQEHPVPNRSFIYSFILIPIDISAGRVVHQFPGGDRRLGRHKHRPPRLSGDAGSLTGADALAAASNLPPRALVFPQSLVVGESPTADALNSRARTRHCFCAAAKSEAGATDVWRHSLRCYQCSGYQCAGNVLRHSLSGSTFHFGRYECRALLI